MSGLELFLWSPERSRDIQIELRHPGQNKRGSRRWWADPLAGATRTRAWCQHNRAQEMVTLQRNLSTFKWLLRSQRNHWSTGKSDEEFEHNIVLKRVLSPSEVCPLYSSRILAICWETLRALRWPLMAAIIQDLWNLSPPILPDSTQWQRTSSDAGHDWSVSPD